MEFCYYVKGLSRMPKLHLLLRICGLTVFLSSPSFRAVLRLVVGISIFQRCPDIPTFIVIRYISVCVGGVRCLIPCDDGRHHFHVLLMKDLSFGK